MPKGQAGKTPLMGAVLIAGTFFAFLYFSTGAYASGNPEAFDVIKTSKSESFSLPFEGANRVQNNPLVYTFDAPKQPNWILGITNNVTYAAGNDSKVVVRLQEPAPSQKFIDIEMYGGPKHSYLVAVNSTGSGYSVIYSQESGGWTTDGQISVSHANDQGLTVTDGKRIVVDRLDIQGFSMGSIAVFGKENSKEPDNALAGNLSFEVLAGDPSNSPLYYVPLGIMIGMGGLMGALLYFKKRKPSD